MQNLLQFGFFFFYHFSSGLLLEINVISAFRRHELNKEDELLVANVIEGEQIQILEGFFFLNPDMMQFPGVQGMIDHDALKAHCT